MNQNPLTWTDVKIDGQRETLYPFSLDFVRDLAEGKLKTDINIPLAPYGRELLEQGRDRGLDPDKLKPELLKRLKRTQYLKD